VWRVLCVVRTTIGYGAKKQGTEGVHGSPLGEDLKAVKTKFGFDPNQSFVVDSKVYAALDRKAAGAKLVAEWNALVQKYTQQYPKEGAELARRLGLGNAQGPQYPANWQALLPTYKPTDKADSTRKLSQIVLNALAPALPELVGGSADLTPSTFTDLKCRSVLWRWLWLRLSFHATCPFSPSLNHFGVALAPVLCGGVVFVTNSKDYQKNTPDGRYIRFGVREHGTNPCFLVCFCSPPLMFCCRCHCSTQR
jgi:transketolase